MMRLALAIAVVFAGCKPENARQAERAAKDVIAQHEDVEQAVRQGPAQVAAEAKELTEAAKLFIERRRIRIAALRGEHSVISSQVLLISTMSEYFPLTDAGRADINNKLSELLMKLDEAKNHIEGLAGTAADHWEQRDDAVRDVMEQLDTKRRAAWRALQDAPRVHRNAT